MAVPSSGELRLYADIGTEIGVAQSNVSLGAMSDTAGFSAPDSMSDFYGYADASAPSATTYSLSNISETSMRLNGTITSDGGAAIIERGFYFGRNSSSPTNNTKYTVGGTTGAYNLTVSGLSSGSNHYCWAFATNSAGTTYGSRVNAATIPTFNPTFSSNLYRQRIQYVQQTIDPAGNCSVSFRKYYINPYTNAYVQHGFSKTQTAYADWNMGTYNKIEEDLQTGDPTCTNARNVFRSLAYGSPSGTTYAYSSFQYQIYGTGADLMTNRVLSGSTMNGGPSLITHTSNTTYVRMYGYGYNTNRNTMYYDYSFDYGPA